MNGAQGRSVFRFYGLYLYHIVLYITMQEQEICNFVKKHLQEFRKGVGDREGRPYGEAETGGVEPRPYGGVTRSAVSGPSGTPAPTEGYKRCGRTGGVEPRPYGGVTRSAVNGPPGICRRGPPFGFLGKKIPASKAGSILPYYAGGDNARKNFVVGEILSHTMIFF